MKKSVLYAVRDAVINESEQKFNGFQYYHLSPVSRRGAVRVGINTETWLSRLWESRI
jgi:hypothetical protein